MNKDIPDCTELLRKFAATSNLLDLYKRAELLKTATTLGVTKQLIKLLKSQGIKIKRPRRLSNDNIVANTPWLSPKEKKYIKMFSEMNAPAPEYDPNNKVLSIPKGTYSQRVGRNKFSLSPRMGLFHEGGHAMHFLEDKKLVNLLNKRIMGISPDSNYVTGLSEIIANNNAINFMREHGAPKRAISAYVKQIKPGYDTYLKSFQSNNKEVDSYFRAPKVKKMFPKKQYEELVNQYKTAPVPPKKHYSVIY